MQEIVFATNNQHKLEEIRRIVGDRFNVLSLEEIGCHEDIPETAETLEGNAWQKARYVKEHYGYDCFADDTGLMVDALAGNAPGNDMRFYWERVENSRNFANKVWNASRFILMNMEGKEVRTARFVTVIALILGGKEMSFCGKVEGTILDSPEGDGGFGYDPVFRPDGEDCSFAMMSADAKNAISHRGRATAMLLDYLNSI